MNRVAFVLACVLAMAPGVASAALSIAVFPDIALLDQNPTGEFYFDLVFNETGTPTNEGLFAYDLYLQRDKPGINLIRAEKPDNWVFTSPGAVFQESERFSNKPDLIVVNAIGGVFGPNQDIVNGTKAARVFYTMDPGFAPGTYHIYLDPSGTLFVSGDTGEVIPVDMSDAGTVTYVPEPTGLTLVGAACALAPRRRRRA
jgi:hypothetical protein